MDTNQTIDFMTFWHTTNKVLNTYGKEEITWAEARQWWKSAQEQQAHDALIAKIEEIKRVVAA